MQRQFLLALAGIFLLTLTCSKSSLKSLENEITEVAEKVSPSVVLILVKDGLTQTNKVASGVVVKENEILTTESATRTAEDIKIQLQDGKILDSATIAEICCDFETNLTLIKLKNHSLKPVPLDKEKNIKNGSLGIAVSNTSYSKGLKVSMGTLGKSWIGGQDAYDAPLLTFEGILPTNPGGIPIFNNEGELIGIVEGKIQGQDHISLVLPVGICEKALNFLESEGLVKRGWIGVYMESKSQVTGEAAEEEPGILVTRVIENSSAFKAGLRKGDLIFKVDGEKVHSSAHLRKLISSSAIGEKIKLEIVRGKENQTVEVLVEPTRYNMQGMRRCSLKSI